MKKLGRIINFILYTILTFTAANIYAVVKGADIYAAGQTSAVYAVDHAAYVSYSIQIVAFAIIVFLCFIWINLFPVFFGLLQIKGRLRVCDGGCRLLRLFLSSTILSVIFFIYGMCGMLPFGTPVQEPRFWIINSIIAIILEAILFWNGIIRVYLSSEQLGIRIRVIGIICGMIPIANLAALWLILRTASAEISFENKRRLRNQARKDERLCATKYPLLLVHGVFFRDFRYFNYWGRIPKELQENGAVIFYGNHQSAASVSDSAAEIAARIIQIVNETGCEKVNIIGHSKGGLDSRAALQLPGVAEHVASLTTINTPHRGCEFADYLLTKIPMQKQQAIADMYNTALNKMGDPNPDFLGAVRDLTASACKDFNACVPDIPDVYYQSIGSRLNKARGGRFPLNFTYPLAKHFDGPNDGLVGEKSFSWGVNYRFLTVSGSRGISHGDMIDLNRENIPAFDVREFYVQLVNGLKQKGF